MALFCLCVSDVYAQIAPTQREVEQYAGLHLAAFEGDLSELGRLTGEGADLELRDGRGRTAVHVAAYASHESIIEALATAGANLNTLEYQSYDIVTIAAVANDLEILDIALKLGARPDNIISPYEGTALIAAAHLGRHEVAKRLIVAGAPFDHLNNLNWTALIEAVVLGDGAEDHIETVRLLVDAGADKSIADSNGLLALELATQRGYNEMVRLLQAGN